MQAGSLAGGPVRPLRSYAIVNGVQRPMLDWSVDREIGSDLPAGVAGGTGVVQATGKVTWAPDPVDDGSRSPWNPGMGWVPAAGDRIEIWQGDDDTSWIQFTGFIDDTTGTVGGTMTSTVVDGIDSLSARADLPPLVDVLPPIEDTGAFRRVRISPRGMLVLALRRGGFYRTPAPEAHSVVDVPAVSTMWPHIGTVTYCTARNDESLTPDWPDGIFLANCTARYAPAGPRTGDRAVQLTMNVGADHAAVASLQVLYGSRNMILRATATAFLVIIDGTVVCTIYRGAGDGDVVVQALITNGNVRLRTSSGGDVSGSAPWGVTAAMTGVAVGADPGSRVNGFIVSHPEQPWHEFSNLNWSPTVRIGTGLMHGSMAALRGTRTASVRDVMDDAASALLLPYWIDEAGVMQVVASDVLRGRSSQARVTTADDILSLAWRRDLLAHRSRVQVSYDAVAITRHRTHSASVWEPGSTITLENGETDEQIITPGPDEDWIMVHTGWYSLTQVDQVNRGRGTWAGGMVTDGATSEWTNTGGVTNLDIALDTIGPQAWKFTHTAKNLTGAQQIQLRTQREDFSGTSVLWREWYGQNLPILRAKAAFTVVDVDYPAVTTGGVGPALEHDCGLWATSHLAGSETTVVKRIRDFLAEQVQAPHPVITGMSILPDPRLQLGDVITVDSDLLGVSLRCLIVGKHSSGSRDGHDLTLDVRVLDVTVTATTWQAFEDALPDGMDYTAFEALWGPSATYTDFNNDPLRGQA